MIDPQPPVYLGNLRIDEPVTVLTDLLVSAVCFLAFFRLAKKSDTKVISLLRYYFLSMGVATALGGIIGHGFLYALSFYWKLPGWLISMFSIALLERAVIEKSRELISVKFGRFFARLNLIELATFIILTFSTLNFFFVEVHSAYGLLVVVSGFSFFHYRKTKNPGSKLFLWGVAVSSIAALVFMNDWGFNKWFNHYDISHILMAISAYLFYSGAERIERN